MPHHSSTDLQADGPDARELEAATIALVKKWLADSANAPADPAAERLAGVLKDPNGLDFTVGFVDGVMRPEDLMVAGHNLQAVAGKTPRFLPWYMRGAVGLGGMLGPVLPWVVIPVARRVLREMVGHLVVDATPDKLGPVIEQLRSTGNRLNLNLLGEAVLGQKEADRRLEGTRALLARPDVDYVSIKVSAVSSQLSMWSFDEEVERTVARLTPLYELAANSAPVNGRTKFINLDMEEYRDLDLTIAVFERILDQPQLLELEAGIVLQAYLPDALSALQGLTEWSKRRRARGGAPIKVRLVKGANLAMEHVDAAVHEWPLATYSSKQDSDTNYKRVLNWALTYENTDAVRLGVAGHNLFDVAFAWLLAGQRGVQSNIEFEMLLGMATGQAEAVKKDVGELLLYTPVVNPAEFDVAIAYLIRRLEENASQENFMSAVFELNTSAALLQRETDRFRASLAELDSVVPGPNRTQNRAAEHAGPAESVGAGYLLVDALRPPTHAEPAEQADPNLTAMVLGLSRGEMAAALEAYEPEVHAAEAAAAASAPAPTTPESIAHVGFHNEPDTDPALPANRAWGRAILAKVEGSTLGTDVIDAAQIKDAAVLERVIDTVAHTGIAWGKRSGAERAEVLHRAGRALAANRGRLIEVMASETGKTIAEADPEISEAIDFAHYYAERAKDLDAVQGARFVPSQLTVVTPPWNFPVAIPAGSVLSALAAGSGVIIKPAKLARRSGAIMVQALWEAGVPRELLALVDFAGEARHELGRQLVSHPSVDRVILTGGYETAELFRSFRPDLPLLAETSGKNAVIVTPSADLDQAASDVIKSAFGHAGQKCSAASLVIVVGSVARSKRFESQLVDAATSLQVGYPSDPETQMGPIIEPANGKLLHALTQLGADERWLVEPKQLDDSGTLWSPGIRTGVAAGSYFHLTEFFGPVLGVMHARNLEEAIRFQNAVDYGLTAGLHSLDAEELALWLDTVEAGNLYVNRGTTGAIVQRQPFGGWKRSSVGAGTKAGGPNYLFGLGSWVNDPGTTSQTLHLRGLDERVTTLIEASQPALGYEEFDVLRRSALSDAIAWAEEFGTAKDVSGVGLERNVFRYRALPVTVRISEAASLGHALRVIAAGVRSRSRFDVSTALTLPAGVLAVLASRDLAVRTETDAAWLERAAGGGIATSRVRLVDAVGGGASAALSAALGGSPDVAIYDHEVTQAGRVELLPFLREQAISITAHRFGNPSTLSEGVI
ncbi:bifunctional proline dehydrogenase/L-glutamate gamma-semialdehyde dehydrogenase [Microterricola viridarii]|uniref:L-glutamate gamma-semialdehyde dehydrogenase n=1 Tax=Microterricola viridarii TaxID=412690 RepID=A0A120I183_9MICO|nr:bifunctional proline dehydrogenase/L-glutamate gamma-semialdehyde dehydrogenase [Microterricola viridarii]AMB60590.1 1-pyrroline-5-carboxylate dehydrogenase [Microterricola viridarii]